MISGFVVFPMFMLLNGVSAFVCWMSIRKDRKQLCDNRISYAKRVFTRTRSVLMVLPLSAFIFGFLFFTIKLLEEIFR